MRLDRTIMALAAMALASCVSQSGDRNTHAPVLAPKVDSATAAAMTGPICTHAGGEATPDGSDNYCFFRADLDENSVSEAASAKFIGNMYQYQCKSIDVLSKTTVKSSGTPEIELIRVGFKCHR